jgi:uncharacterized PurR-regulated membrane protein YhhQ (DUF165 family)
MQTEFSIDENRLSSNPEIAERRERVFFVLAAFFICCMTLLNVIGITRFIQLGPLQLALGVLPYPLTFLCTDLISEFYGRKRANFVVSVGLLLNFFILGYMWLGNSVTPVPATDMPPWQMLELAEPLMLPSGQVIEQQIELFRIIYECTSGAVFASMLAYMAAQYADVRLYHFWKQLTKGKHLWLRNNFSTMTSQAIDSVAVISVTFGAAFLAGDIAFKGLLILMGSNYVFKLLVALIDTLPLYLIVFWLRKYLHENQAPH